MTCDGEKTNRTGVREASEPFNDAGSPRAEPRGRELLDPHQFTVSGPTGIALCYPVLVAIAAVGWNHLPALATVVKDANNWRIHKVEHPGASSADLAGSA